MIYKSGTQKVVHTLNTPPYPTVQIHRVLAIYKVYYLNRVIQFKNLNPLFLTQKHHTRGWGQIINPIHIVMLFFESLVRFGLTMKKVYLFLLIITTFGFENQNQTNRESFTS